MNFKRLYEKVVVINIYIRDAWNTLSDKLVKIINIIVLKETMLMNSIDRYHHFSIFSISYNPHKGTHILCTCPALDRARLKGLGWLSFRDLAEVSRCDMRKYTTLDPRQKLSIFVVALRTRLCSMRGFSRHFNLT